MKQAPVVVASANETHELGEPVRPGLWLVTPAAETSDGLKPPKPGWVGMHGSGTVRGTFVAHSGDLQRVPSDCSVLEDTGAAIRGSLTLYHLASSGSASILPDPLGSGLVFLYTRGSTHLASSDLGALVQVAGRLGLAPKKSLAYLSLVVATGSGGFGLTPYEGVGVVPPGKWLRLSGRGIKVQSYKGEAQLHGELVPYNDALQAAEEEFLSNVTASAKYECSYRISHLTGGSDSRLVLAALRKAGVESDFTYYCSGGPGDSDFDIASRICAAVPVSMSSFSGYFEDNLSSSWQEHLVGALNATAGLLLTPASVWAKPREVMILSGGYGEFLRSFYNHGKSASLPAEYLAEMMYGTFGMGREAETCILAPGTRDRFVTLLRASVHDARELGVREDALLDYLYMTGRNRYYVGEISRTISNSAHRFDPLYSVFAARASLALEGPLRNANVFGLDLMRRLDAVLAAMPFDRERYEVFESLRGPVTRVDFPDLQPRVLPRPDWAMSHARMRWEKPRPTAEQVAFSRSLGMPSRYIAEYEILQRELPRLLAEVPQSELGEIFNLPLLRRHLKSPPRRRPVYRALTNLFASLSWYLKGDVLGQRPLGT